MKVIVVRDSDPMFLRPNNRKHKVDLVYRGKTIKKSKEDEENTENRRDNETPPCDPIDSLEL